MCRSNSVRIVRSVGVVLVVSLWAWHCHDPETSSTRRGVRLDLSPEAARRKHAATLCFGSQIGGFSPVVPARMLVRLRRSYEVYVPCGLAIEPWSEFCSSTTPWAE